MKRIREIKYKYFQGNIGKPDFINKMHDIHEYLFEYADIIKDTDIAKIEIADDLIILTTRSTGLKFICDSVDKRIAPIEILNFNNYEKAEFDFISKLLSNLQILKSSDLTIFDIGANIGWYSINLADKFKNINIYAFEPVPKTFNYLKENLLLNNLNNILICNFGFSDKDGMQNIYYYPEGSVNASLKQLSELSNVKTVECSFKRIDDFVNGNNIMIDFIKCDVEGAELLVFKGALKTLAKQKPVVFTEMLRKWAAKFKYHPNDIINLFKNLGYKCFIIKENKLNEFFSVEEDTIETNYFFIHQEKLPLFKILIH